MKKCTFYRTVYKNRGVQAVKTEGFCETLTDKNGNKITLDSLNGYQKGVVLNDCMAYFTGGTYHENSDEPCGVIKIEEKEI